MAFGVKSLLPICVALNLMCPLLQVEVNAGLVTPALNASPNARSGGSVYWPDPPLQIHPNCTDETPIYDTVHNVCVSQGIPITIAVFLQLENVFNLFIFQLFFSSFL